MTTRARRRFYGLSAVLLLALLTSFWLKNGQPEPPAAPAKPAVTTPDTKVRARRTRPSRVRNVPYTDPDTPCAKAVEERCHQGDVWLFDGCGRAEEKLEECGRQLCRGDECEEEPSEPCSEPEEGRCDGDTIRLCFAGRARSVDCAARGLRCVLGEEGAECAEPVPPSERCTRAGARCEQDVLVQCEQGRISRTDCTLSAAKCLRVPNLIEPRCVHVVLPDLSKPACGPCGCPASNSSQEERCDGHDDDGNGLIDDGLTCGPIDVVAFIVTDAAGRTSHAREDVEAEIAQLNGLFADEQETPRMSFVLADVQTLNDGALLDLDGSEFTKLASDPRLHPARPNFYVPLLFTDSIDAQGSAPKLGIATLPNGTCGGLQEGYGPELGLVAVAKARSLTTVSHEMGHFFGLCHTHDEQRNARLVAVPDSRGQLLTCRPSCLGEGDGVCDTPFDPGPNVCRFDVQCQSACAADARPDVGNLMSYYTPCRQRFSPEQRSLMQHTLALRRAWYKCTERPCVCELGDTSCPVGMACRELVSSDGSHVRQCLLDGPRAPGSVCESAGQCGQGSLCVNIKSGGRRCVRPCAASSLRCECSKVADDLSVCLEDLR